MPKLDTPSVIELDGNPHVIGNPECAYCWSGYPQEHQDCGGLMHAEFGDENWDGDYWLITRCDKCGVAE